MTESKTTSMTLARVSKNDVFRTPYKEVKEELSHYPDEFFRGKRVLLPADGADSAFLRYFEENFHRWGMEELIATSYNPDGAGGIYIRKKGRHPQRDGNLMGNGDFRSLEVTAIKDQVDMVVTKPPFSLMREFYKWARGKDLIFIAPLVAIGYLDLLPDILGGKLFSGYGFSKTMHFEVDGKEGYNRQVRKRGKRWVCPMGSICWLTSFKVDREKRLILKTMKENLEEDKRLGGEYRIYDNLHALEVPFVKAIPSNYDGLMGVPISYFGYHDPDRFEIVGMWNNGRLGKEVGATSIQVQTGKSVRVMNGPILDGRVLYKRFLIRRKK